MGSDQCSVGYLMFQKAAHADARIRHIKFPQFRQLSLHTAARGTRSTAQSLRREVLHHTKQLSSGVCTARQRCGLLPPTKKVYHEPCGLVRSAEFKGTEDVAACRQKIQTLSQSALDTCTSSRKAAPTISAHTKGVTAARRAPAHGPQKKLTTLDAWRGHEWRRVQVVSGAEEG